MLHPDGKITCDECNQEASRVPLMVAGTSQPHKSCLHICSTCIFGYLDVLLHDIKRKKTTLLPRGVLPHLTTKPLPE